MDHTFLMIICKKNFYRFFYNMIWNYENRNFLSDKIIQNLILVEQTAVVTSKTYVNVI